MQILKGQAKIQDACFAVPHYVGDVDPFYCVFSDHIHFKQTTLALEKHSYQVRKHFPVMGLGRLFHMPSHRDRALFDVEAGL